MKKSERPSNETNSKNPQRLDIEFRLARAWQLKGKTDEALKRYKEILRANPNYAPAFVQLGKIKLFEGKAKEALEYFQKALEIDPDQPMLKNQCEYLIGVINGKNEQLAAFTSFVSRSIDQGLVNIPGGKINLRNQLTVKSHRSGWDFAISALIPLHNDDGVLFDGFIERNFASEHFRQTVRDEEMLELMKLDGTFDHLATSEEKGITPYKTPWVGFLHNPQKMPSWFLYQNSPQSIFRKEIWKKSLPYCIGLFTLSNYHADWLREQTGMPVSAFIHPTDIPELIFNYDAFLDNPNKKIVQIGWWLRKLNAIYQLPISADNPMDYEKIRLIPQFSVVADNLLNKLISIETKISRLRIERDYLDNTREILHLPNQEYDLLLSENIVFLELYDSNANNTIIECIARATPLLVNPLPAVVEYLGENYPLYFKNIQEAAEKALDKKLILDAHLYLKSCETRKKLTPSYFLKSFRESEVYRSI